MHPKRYSDKKRRLAPPCSMRARGAWLSASRNLAAFDPD
jgi:hypothetical protein